MKSILLQKRDELETFSPKNLNDKKEEKYFCRPSRGHKRNWLGLRLSSEDSQTAIRGLFGGQYCKRFEMRRLQ